MALVGLLLRRDRVVAVALGAAAAFPQSAGVALGSVAPVPVFVCVAAVAAVGGLLTRDPRRFPSGFGLLVVFALFAWTWTVLGPWVFEGALVLGPRGGLNNPERVLVPLGWSETNLTQSVILLAALCAVFFLARTGTALFTLEVSVWTCVAASFVREPLRLAGADVLAPYIDTLNAWYAVYEVRWRGVFSEPSLLAGFATAVVVFSAARALTTGSARTRVASVVLAAAAAVLLVGAGAGTGAVAMIVIAPTAGVLLVVRFVRSGGKGAPWYVLGALVAVLAALTVGSTAVSGVVEVVTAKVGTNSQVSRGGSDTIGLDLLLHTVGLGVGLGGNRSSSFAVSLLSTVGVVGSVLFIAVVVAAVRGAHREPTRVAAAAGLLALLVAKAVALPDLGDPLLWLLLAASWPGRGSVGSDPCDGVEWAGPASATSPSRTSRATPSTSPAWSPTHPRPSPHSRPSPGTRPASPRGTSPRRRAATPRASTQRPCSPCGRPSWCGPTRSSTPRTACGAGGTTPV
ncbi:hypothetical protein Cus16_1511 [Curtobacterium sp. ER1/6]|nr:hypothetical protein Cus16_1511 [Curtobacterium sp. ER1/6]